MTKKTELKPTIWKAMMQFRGKVDQVERTSKNEFLSYKYANINIKQRRRIT